MPLPEQKLSNFVLVLTGGGMRCAWSAGFLYGLAENKIFPKAIIATSGTIGSAVYFALQQTQSVKRIFTEHLPESSFINFARLTRIIDIDFLIDDVFKKREPIDWRSVALSPVRIISPVREITGYIKVFSNKDMGYEVLRASMAMPLFYRKTVHIQGKEYCDHPFSPRELIEYAPYDSRVILVDVRTTNNFLRKIGKIIVGVKEQTESIPESVITINPQIPYHLLTSSKQKLTELFENGRKYALEYKGFEA